MESVSLVLAFALVVFIAAGSIYWHYTRSRALLDTWAKENAYEIVESSFRHFARGPFFWTTSKGQAVYYVTVIDARGTRRSGWVRCGGWFLGLLADKVEVRWE